MTDPAFGENLGAVAGALEAFIEVSRAADRPVLMLEPIGDLIERLDLARWARSGGLGGADLATFVERYLSACTALHHPGYMAHQVAVPNLTGALAGLVDAATNNAMTVYEMGPAPSAVEFFVINWMLDKVGWPPMALGGDASTGGGVLTHGGSLANLTALIAARNHAVPGVWETGVTPGLALMAPATAHYSISRAAGILGIGQRGIVQLDVDSRGAVIADRLPDALARAAAMGLRPFALVANACSTPVGIYDPLAEIAAFCRSNDLWMHVDAAHGASALLAPTRRRLLDGLQDADSFVWDAHKMLQSPVLCAAVLVRDHRTLDQAFQQDASYLFHEKDQPGVDFGRRSFECSKSAIGLRCFLALAALGETRLAESVDRQCDLAQQAYELIAARPGFECAVRPESNIVCWRVEGDDALQMRVRAAILAEGRHYISSTMFAGKRWLRLVLLNPATDIEHIAALMDSAERHASLSRAGSAPIATGG
ncbi:MAG: diaminobutyrate decarboxylase [Armatimonadetes bacterium]|nr:diaminobutyrate decarboxylase [Armatimonadota bacterium]